MKISILAQDSLARRQIEELKLMMKNNRFRHVPNLKCYALSNQKLNK